MNRETWKATVVIEFQIDGKCPTLDLLETAIGRMVSEAGYIGSEEVDGSEDWGLEIGRMTLEVRQEGGGE